MDKIQVNLGERSYSILISDNLLDKVPSLLSLQTDDTVVIITDKNVATLYLHSLRNILQKNNIKVDEIILPHGEKCKSLFFVDKIISILLKKQYGKDIIFFALGGGVIGDLVGFVSSIYQRGTRFIQIPTTLLAQVDASIGGKTAINHTLGKNMIGTYHHPSLVVINTNFLNTLSERDLSSGLAEIIKYSIIFDNEFFVWLEHNLDNLISLRTQYLIYCIKKCCELKTRVVITDEVEKNIRMYLNLGHTYAHAIEAYLGYSEWMHGEAVSAGIIMSIYASLRLGNFHKKDLERVKKLFLRSKLPIKGPVNMPIEGYLSYMKRDKKKLSNKLRIVLPINIGKVNIYDNVSDSLLRSSISDCLNQ